MPVLTFLGATGTVTGSRFLLDTPRSRILVDCGLYQGRKELRLRNWEPFPVDPASIDAVVLTHAHVDHSGYLPALAAAGFTGPVHATPDTVALAGIVLPDSGHLQEEEAAYANRMGYSKHHPALALYTEQDARACLSQLEAVGFGERVAVGPDVELELRPAGHILGSAVVRLTIERAGGERRLAFSGDLGRPQHPILVPPSPLGPAEVVVCESTYGDRSHDDEGAIEALGAAIVRTARRGGVVVVPAFAVDRTEVLLVHLGRLLDAGAIPELPVYVDSPMALAALGVYRAAIAAGAPDVRPEVHTGGDPFERVGVIEVTDVEASMALDRLRGPAIVISASGMATGGRVLHHLARYLPDRRACVVLVGYQADQTRGRQLAEGARQVKMLGRYVTVSAEVVDLPSFSVHADREDLRAWLATAEGPPEAVYLVHGEPDAAEALAAAASSALGCRAVVPRHGERVRLD